MPSLNELAASVLGKLDDPFNYELGEQIKFSFKYYRAFLLRREFERNGGKGMSSLRQSIDVNMQQVDKTDTCIVNVSDCLVLRTVNKVPTPIRGKRATDFYFVGSLLGKPYTYVEPYEFNVITKNKYIKKTIYYTIINGYIYQLNGSTRQKYLRLESLFSDPSEVRSDCSDINCFDDDMEFPLGLDMVDTIIKGMLSGEYSIVLPDNEEVRINVND